MGLTDFSLLKAERADSGFAATLSSELGKKFGWEDHRMGEVGTPTRLLLQGLLGQSNLGQLLRSLPVQLRSHLSFDYMSLVLRTEGGNGLVWYAPDHKDPSALACTQLVPTEQPLLSWVVAHQKAAVIQNIDKEIRFPSLKNSFKGPAMKSACAVPLTSAHCQLGAIFIGSAKSDFYSQEYARFFSAIAGQIAMAVDNARSHAKLKRYEASSRSAQAEIDLKSARLKLLFDLTNSMAGTVDLGDVLKQVTTGARKLMRSDFAILGLLDSESGRLHVNAFSLSEGTLLDDEAVGPLAEVLFARVVFTGNPSTGKAAEFAEIDTKTDPNWATRGFKTSCVLPLVSRDQVLGVLALGRRGDSDYDSSELEFLKQVSSQVAIAIENAIVTGELQKLKENFGIKSECLKDEIRGEPNFEGIVGKSDALQCMLREVEVVAPTESGVLIQGETGTGKELIARAIHNLSARRDQPFIKLNCAAIPSGLLESELFGHEKGAFTGAITRKAGRFEVADKGTLLLDEVGDIPLELQPKLLRVLQEREFERLGSTRTQQVDVRVIAATHRDLKRMVEDGRFRSDLFYRLHVFPLNVPPLRDRRQDIPILVRHYVDKYAKRMNRLIETIPSHAMEVFASYSWPGNVRELQNFIERAVILSTGSTLRPPLADLKEASKESSSELSTLEETEREHVLRALRESNWVIAGPNGAAARLGMKRTTLAYRIRKLKIACRPQ
jgi:formate hydrogenlyase transcriptional activator